MQKLRTIICLLGFVIFSSHSLGNPFDPWKLELKTKMFLGRTMHTIYYDGNHTGRGVGSDYDRHFQEILFSARCANLWVLLPMESETLNVPALRRIKLVPNPENLQEGSSAEHAEELPPAYELPPPDYSRN